MTVQCQVAAAVGVAVVVAVGWWPLVPLAVVLWLATVAAGVVTLRNVRRAEEWRTLARRHCADSGRPVSAIVGRCLSHGAAPAPCRVGPATDVGDEA